MKKPIKPIIGVVALVLAITALVGSIFGVDIAEAIPPSVPVGEKFGTLTVTGKDTDVVVDGDCEGWFGDLTVKVRNAVISKLKHRDAVMAVNDRMHDWHTTIAKLAMGLGVLGLIMAAVSHTREESRAVAVSAAGMGVVALAWQAMMTSL